MTKGLRVMKKLLLSIFTLSFFSSYTGDEKLELKRSDAVIKDVWFATDLAICGTTLKAFHGECQLKRCTQKCPDCSHWDVEFFPAIIVAQRSTEKCAICDKKIEYVPGFLK